MITFPRTGVARALLLVFVALTAGALVRTVSTARHFAAIPRGSMMYGDLRIFLRLAKGAGEGERLYLTDDPSFAVPGSAVYKYPPPLAAMLQPLTGLGWRHAARILLVVNSVVLLLALTVCLRATRLPWQRLAVAVLAFLSWRPFWESMAGMQLEMTILLLLSLTATARLWGRSFWSGVPVGIAAALKVYPAALIAWFAWRRDLRAIAGATVGAAATLAASAAVLDPAFVTQFISLLPGLGGTALGPDNLGLLGNTGRLGVVLFQGSGTLRDATALGRASTVLDTLASPSARVFALALAGLIEAGLFVTTWRGIQRGPGAVATTAPGPGDGRRYETITFGAAICLLLVMMPTSWPDYQTLLFLPFVLALAWIGPPRADPLAWGLLAAALLASAISPDQGWLLRHPEWTVAVRGWIPLAIWGALLRCSTARIGPHVVRFAASTR